MEYYRKPKPEMKDEATTTHNKSGEKCDFCTRHTHDLENLIELSQCGHKLCPNCFNMLKSYEGRKYLCPICLKPANELRAK